MLPATVVTTGEVEKENATKFTKKNGQVIDAILRCTCHLPRGDVGRRCRRIVIDRGRLELVIHRCRRDVDHRRA